MGKKVSKKEKSNNVNTLLPTDIEMDSQILKIMDDNLYAGTVADNTEGIICNRFATSLKIVHYIKKLINNDAKFELSQLKKKSEHFIPKVKRIKKKSKI